MKVSISLALSAYIPDHFSTGSAIASLLLRTTISLPKSRRYRTSVPFGGQSQICREQNGFRTYRNDWTTT